MLRVRQIAGTNKPVVSSASTDLGGSSPRVLTAPARGSTFVVKLRDPRTRSWGNEYEVLAKRQAQRQLPARSLYGRDERDIPDGAVVGEGGGGAASR